MSWPAFLALVGLGLLGLIVGLALVVLKLVDMLIERRRGPGLTDDEVAECLAPVAAEIFVVHTTTNGHRDVKGLRP